MASDAPKKPRRRKAAEAPANLVLEAQCTLREAEALKAALLAAEDSSGDFVIDGAAVERVDTAGLQLLAGFVVRLRLTDRRLAWRAASTPLRDAARQLDLAQAMALDAERAA